MTKIISFHSFKGGTGKTNLTVNTAYQLATQGYRVAVIDMDIFSSGIHVPFEIVPSYDVSINRVIAEFGQFVDDNKQAMFGMTPHDLSDKYKVEGKLYFIPSMPNTTDIAILHQEGYDSRIVADFVFCFSNKYQLDYLLMDSHPGMQHESLLVLSVSDIVFVVMRPDYQDVYGTAILIDLLSHIKAKYQIVLNKCNRLLNTSAFKERLEKQLTRPILTIIESYEELEMLNSSKIFSHVVSHHDFMFSLNTILEKIKQL